MHTKMYDRTHPVGAIVFVLFGKIHCGLHSDSSPTTRLYSKPAMTQGKKYSRMFVALLWFG